MKKSFSCYSSARAEDIAAIIVNAAVRERICLM